MNETKPKGKKPLPRKPDYILSAMDKATGAKSKVGCAWGDADGSLSIRLDAFVVLYGHNENLVLKLFPNDQPKPNGSD